MSTKTIDHIALTVRDHARMADFYRTALGLEALGEERGITRLGAGSRVLLELRHDPTATARDPHQAGLFHTAFLLPSRSDLADWMRHAAESGLRLTGASDHGVSEAIYLDDPEGNGIASHADRPETGWISDGDRVDTYTRRLELQELLVNATGRNWKTAPSGTVIGHVHLQVGELDTADDFFRGELGLTRSFDAPGGAWYGWNGYHHHLAGNIWNSRGAGPRDPNMTGLAEIVVNSPDASGQILQDPWGTRFRMI